MCTRCPTNTAPTILSTGRSWWPNKGQEEFVATDTVEAEVVEVEDTGVSEDTEESEVVVEVEDNIGYRWCLFVHFIY